VLQYSTKRFVWEKIRQQCRTSFDVCFAKLQAKKPVFSTSAAEVDHDHTE
jgi:hypothetical protein